MSERRPEIPDFPASQLFLRRLAYSLVRDAARAEDLVQETWAAWVEHRPSGLAEPRAWLARVLRNRAFNAKRADARRARHEALAGRPDPSAPETDGTLEAQAQLVAALRGLDEPYRSTLVQRYYHDLAPREIAERSGTPLNTVKARLARGLERLRAELDRRYHGDRKAWCHWLTVMGPGAPATQGAPRQGLPPVPLTAGAGALQALGGATVLGKTVLFSALLVSVLALVRWRTERPPPQPLEIRHAPPSLEATTELSPLRRERTRGSPGPTPLAAPAVTPAPEPPSSTPAFPAPLPFAWPQLAGTPAHDAFTAARGREDLILRPRVRFTIEGPSGQPTIAGTELYAGGASLFRVDLADGTARQPSADVLERIMGVRAEERTRHEWAEWLYLRGEDMDVRVAPAPALGEDVVIARMVFDGSVSGFDRDLTYERWRWEPEDPGPCLLSGCLVGNWFVAAHRREVVALSAANGAVDWRFEAEDEVHMVPASDGDLVYFATRGGVVYGLDLASGKERWRRETGRAYGWALPVALGDRIVLLDCGESGDAHPWRTTEMKAFQTYDGRELWSVSWHGTSWQASARLGVSAGRLLSAGRDVEVRTVESGELVQRFAGSARACAAPVWAGDTLYTLDAEDGLSAHDVKTGAKRWSFLAERGVGFLDFVHAGDQIYVSTTSGLVCLADDPEKGPAPPGFVLGPAERLRGLGYGDGEDEGERELEHPRKRRR